MGIPVEPRLSETARRKRKRCLSPTGADTLLCDRPSQLVPNLVPISSDTTRNFGVNRDTLNSMISYYESQNESSESGSQKGRLMVVRTVLPTRVRPHRSTVSRLEDRITRLLAREGEIVEYAGLFESGDEEGLENNTQEDERQLMTHVAVSILYVEDVEGEEEGRTWELGCWAGAHRLAGVDMFQIFLDVLTEATTVPSCQIETLCIMHNLEVYVSVAEGIDMLKELSAEMHTTYDKESTYFLHPITGSPIEIVHGG